MCRLSPFCTVGIGKDDVNEKKMRWRIPKFNFKIPIVKKVLIAISNIQHQILGNVFRTVSLGGQLLHVHTTTKRQLIIYNLFISSEVRPPSSFGYEEKRPSKPLISPFLLASVKAAQFDKLIRPAFLLSTRSMTCRASISLWEKFKL